MRKAWKGEERGRTPQCLKCVDTWHPWSQQKKNLRDVGRSHWAHTPYATVNYSRACCWSSADRRPPWGHSSHRTRRSVRAIQAFGYRSTLNDWFTRNVRSWRPCPASNGIRVEERGREGTGLGYRVQLQTEFKLSLNHLDGLAHVDVNPMLLFK